MWVARDRRASVSAVARPIGIGLGLAGRELTEPRLSPAADRVSVVVAERGSSSIVIIDLAVDDPLERLATTGPPPAAGRGLGGGCQAWLDAEHLVYAAIDGHLWCQPLDGAEPVDLTADLDVAGRIGVQAPAVALGGGSYIAFIVDQAEVWVLDVSSGVCRRIDDGTDDFCLDPSIIVDDSAVRVCWQAWSVPSMPWDDSVVCIVTIDRDLGGVVDRRRIAGAGAIQQPRWSIDGSLATVRDDDGWLNLWIEDRPVLSEPSEHAGPTWGPGQSSYALDPGAGSAGAVVVARNEHGWGRLILIGVIGADDADDTAGAGDPGRRVAPAVTELGRGVHGALDRRGDRLVAVRSGARTPTEVVLYELASASASAPATTGRAGVAVSGPIATAVSGATSSRRRTVAVGPALGWDRVDLVEPESLVIDHEGVELHARWYAADPAAARPATALARRLVCMIHGGPTDQWPVGFLWRVALWRSRGWDVLVVDPRGSTGHGRTYQQALHAEWGRLDVDDTAAIIASVQRTGRASPERTLVVGSSSGGMAVLAVLARHGDRVAGGVALSPVCDLADLAARSHRFEAHYAVSLVGDPIRDRQRYVDRSPISSAAALSRPVLVMHGDADPVVPVEQSRRLVAAVEAAGGEIEYHEFAGEGHGLRAPAARRAELEMSFAFGDRLCPPG